MLSVGENAECTVVASKDRGSLSVCMLSEASELIVAKGRGKFWVAGLL